jgi:hypothetical protein
MGSRKKVGGRVVIMFLCGCTSKLEIPIVTLGSLEAVSDYLSTFDGISFDSEGFIQCSIHHCRRYGWRAPNHSPRFGGITDIEYERLIVWGVKPVRPEAEIFVSKVPDLRPYIYEGMLDEKARTAIANANRGVGNSNGYSNGSGSRTSSLAKYCDEATDSGHSSANGLGFK